MEEEISRRTTKGPTTLPFNLEMETKNLGNKEGFTDYRTLRVRRLISSSYYSYTKITIIIELICLAESIGIEPM